MDSIVNPSIPLGRWVSDAIDWFTRVFGWLLDFIGTVLGGMYDGVIAVLGAPTYTVMLVVFAVIAWAAGSWKVALVSVLGFYLVRGVNMWTQTMETLAMVFVAVLIAVIISVPLGIWAAKSPTVSAIVKPLLDFMQAMPALAYLVPIIVIFGIGVVPGMIATLIFCLPPGVRFTELGIRQVDQETVEAGQAFGATPRHILFRIELPLALPTIMAGINQVIMLALSMVVLAGMAGADGLGGPVVQSLQTLNVPLGVNAGVAVVILAIYLDRVTAGLGRKTPLARAQQKA
ncbi:MAG: proline/glycine betaine ABC transporter permease [Corynebacterium sp.]|uniref:ABC transporter permease n=1 Tax=Corynebacterium TaxID=1716 RepID=UPI002648A5CA|nr:proline/glycine betaine ABC transporter permease [Corynebacterium sp.]MDN5723384.1 proline/glycine betaine ABC transporter permease [Corynebacterium sp.]MDN6281556.1 proline/glycine betaine ABC transporter permease [Corynebacterium sp.]MDN6305151.1 proline/glycine betaine ABC transporter permease [Corynebacterium sp.]MDN6353188.1 proline/glycine betaine ABC transporter permease [Corynebacterium sp.]MDN6367384.1 proline/glycine betaine ABC transporter permease [Corynebacterium sp.]